MRVGLAGLRAPPPAGPGHPGNPSVESTAVPGDDERTVEAGGREVRVSRPDKVYFPALGATKFPDAQPKDWGRTTFETIMWMLHLFGGGVVPLLAVIEEQVFRGYEPQGVNQMRVEKIR